jgi:hypothetical protein
LRHGAITTPAQVARRAVATLWRLQFVRLTCAMSRSAFTLSSRCAAGSIAVLGRLSPSADPVVRTPLEMHHRQNPDLIGAKLVQ